MKRQSAASLPLSLLTLWSVLTMPCTVGTVIGGGLKVAPPGNSTASTSR
ncbi:hypothetical protein K7W42_15630 [Deinococcus sp. HMF7604]|nr:hypothetical protein [Deinococcus betulae]MBZ9752283.1 hypothetical protein [Deinococcus betulae]